MKKKLISLIISSSLILGVGILSCIFLVSSFFYERSAGNQFYQLSKYEPSKNSTSFKLVKISRLLERDEFLFYRNRKGEVFTISHVSDDQYECYGSCYCDSDFERRNVAVATSLSFIVAAMSVIVAVNIAGSFFQEECINMYSDECSLGDIFSDVEECQFFEDVEIGGNIDDLAHENEFYEDNEYTYENDFFEDDGTMDYTDYQNTDGNLYLEENEDDRQDSFAESTYLDGIEKKKRIEESERQARKEAITPRRYRCSGYCVRNGRLKHPTTVSESKRFGCMDRIRETLVIIDPQKEKIRGRYNHKAIAVFLKEILAPFCKEISKFEYRARYYTPKMRERKSNSIHIKKAIAHLCAAYTTTGSRFRQNKQNIKCEYMYDKKIRVHKNKVSISGPGKRKKERKPRKKGFFF